MPLSWLLLLITNHLPPVLDEEGSTTTPSFLSVFSCLLSVLWYFVFLVGVGISCDDRSSNGCGRISILVPPSFLSFFFKYPSAAVVADLWFAEERTHVTKNNGSAALKKIFGLVDRES